MWILIKQFVTTIYAKLIQKKRTKLINFLKSQSQQFSNKRKLNANRRLKQKSQHKSKKNLNFLIKSILEKCILI